MATQKKQHPEGDKNKNAQINRHHPVLYPNPTVLFDPSTLQVGVELTNPPRLATLFGMLSGTGCSYSIATLPISQDQLLNENNEPIPGVFVIPTRVNNAFTTEELEAIVNYVNAGGSLLHMSNHAPYSAIDAVLAEKFGVCLTPVFLGVLNTEITNINTNNPVLQVDNVQKICAHDGCLMTINTENPNNPLVLASFTVDNLSDTPPEYRGTEQLFALSLTPGRGKVVYAVNSGWIGDYGTGVPAWGMMPYGNNLAFITSVFGWLLNGNPPMQAVSYEVPKN